MPWRGKGCTAGPPGGRQGHVSLLQYTPDGNMTELQHVELPFCEAMGEVTANADCSVLAASCVTRPNKDADVRAATKKFSDMAADERFCCLDDADAPPPSPSTPPLAPGVSRVCEDTPGWELLEIYCPAATCDCDYIRTIHFAGQQVCTSELAAAGIPPTGTSGTLFTHEFGNPELNCCGCGKQAGTSVSSTWLWANQTCPALVAAGGSLDACPRYPLATAGLVMDGVEELSPEKITPGSQYLCNLNSCNFTRGFWWYKSLNVYLFEWRSGNISATPDAATLVSGGKAEMDGVGKVTLSMNANATLYFVGWRTLAWDGAEFHESDQSTVLVRTGDGGFRRNRVQLPGSHLIPSNTNIGQGPCSGGHVDMSLVAYNTQLDSWAQLCHSDSSVGVGLGHIGFQVVGSFNTILWHGEGSNPAGGLPIGINPYQLGAGGAAADIVPFGDAGWIAVIDGVLIDDGRACEAGETQLGAGDGKCLGPRSTIGLLLLRAQGAAYMAALNETGDGEGRNRAPLVRLAHLTPPGKSIAWAKLAHIGATPNEDRFLLGFATWTPTHQGATPEQFFIVQVAHDGTVLVPPHSIDNAGWHPVTNWAVLPQSRCVTWPHVWPDVYETEYKRGSVHWHGEYRSDDPTVSKEAFYGMYSSKLRVMTYCPPQIAPSAPPFAPGKAPRSPPPSSPPLPPSEPPPSPPFPIPPPLPPPPSPLGVEEEVVRVGASASRWGRPMGEEGAVRMQS